MLPLYEMNCKFKSPARYEDEITIKTSLKEITKVRVVFSYKVINDLDGKLLSLGETMHGWTNKDLKLINAEKAIPEVYYLLSKESCNAH